MGVILKITLWVLVGFSLVHCQRAKKDQTTVIIELPTVSSAKSSFTKSDFGSFTAVNYNEAGPDEPANSGGEDDSWERMTPTGLGSQTERPINCYAVFAGVRDGVVEERMQTSSCYRKAEGIITKQIKFGPWVGGIRADSGVGNSRVELTVDGGADRVFTIIGFSAKDSSYCVDFKANAMPRNMFSKAYILGTTAPITLSGDSQNLNVVVQFNKDDFFDDCDVVDSKEDAPRDLVPQKWRITKNEFPAGVAVQGSCFPADVHLVNAADEIVPAPASVTGVRIYQRARGVTDTIPPHSTITSAAFTYASFNECDSSTNPSDAFTFAKDVFSVRRWVRANASVNKADDLFVTALSPSVYPHSDIISVRGKSPSDHTYTIAGPKEVSSGICVPYFVTVRDYTGLAISGGHNNIKAVIDPGGAAVAHSVWMDDKCETTSAAGQPIPFTFAQGDDSLTSRALFYIKFNGTMDADQKLKIERFTGDPNPNFGQMTLVSRGGDTSNDQFLIVGDQKRFAPGGSCIGPFYATLANKDKVTVWRRAWTGGGVVGTLLAMTVPFKSETGLTFYPEKDEFGDCHGGAMTSLIFPEGSGYSNVFYVYATGSSERRIEIEDFNAPNGKKIERDRFYLKPETN